MTQDNNARESALLANFSDREYNFKFLIAGWQSFFIQTISYISNTYKNNPFAVFV